MHTEPAAIAERGARCAHPTHPLAAVSGAVEVFAVELPRLRMLPSMPRLGACVANATVRLHLRQAPDEALRVRKHVCPQISSTFLWSIKLYFRNFLLCA